MQKGVRAIGDTETLEKVINPQAKVSIRRQCELLGVNRSNVYYQPVPEDPEDLKLMRDMDEEFLKRPTKGVLGMVDFIRGLGILVGPKRVRRLLRVNRNKKCSDFGKKNYSGNGNSLCSNFGNNSAVTVVLN